jgi:hypothetical protein
LGSSRRRRRRRRRRSSSSSSRRWRIHHIKRATNKLPLNNKFLNSASVTF